MGLDRVAKAASGPLVSSADRGLPAALRAIDDFGVDLERVRPHERIALVAAVRQALGVASGAQPLPEGVQLELETRSSESGRTLSLRLTTLTLDLHLESRVSADGEATYHLALESADGFRVEGRREVGLVVVPGEGGVLLVPRDLEFSGPLLDPPPEGPTSTAPAPNEDSQDRLLGFARGAVLGDFSGDDSWSALAGQVAVGFVPIAGQIADVRDLLAALDALGEGRPGAPLAVGAAALGFIPGLDFLKAGTRVGRRALAEAGQNLGEVAERGLKTAQSEMSAEGAERAAKELRVLEVGRLELAARLRAAFDGFERWGLRGAIADQLASQLRATSNALGESAKPSDLVGALRDVFGVPVPKIADDVYDHLREVRSVVRSLQNVAGLLHEGGRHLERRGVDAAELHRLRSAALEMKKRMEALLEVR